MQISPSLSLPTRKKRFALFWNFVSSPENVWPNQDTQNKLKKLKKKTCWDVWKNLDYTIRTKLSNAHICIFCLNAFCLNKYPCFLHRFLEHFSSNCNPRKQRPLIMSRTIKGIHKSYSNKFEQCIQNCVWFLRHVFNNVSLCSSLLFQSVLFRVNIIGNNERKTSETELIFIVSFLVPNAGWSTCDIRVVHHIH